jgi:molybdopterin-binding protein
MKTGLRRHLTPGNAVAMAALVVALGGTAVAQVAIPNGSVTTATLANGSVTTAKLKNGSVKTAKLKNGSVTTAKLRNGSVTTAKIANSGVKSADIANTAVDGKKIANGAVTSDKIAAQTITQGNIAPNVLGGLSASKVNVVTKLVNVAANQPATANCPTGQLAISGGYSAQPIVQVLSNGPTDDRQGWSVTATSAVQPITIITTAVCVAP